MSKILDIIPPDKADQEKIERSSSPKNNFWNLKRVVILAITVVVVAAVFSYFNFANAEIEIHPRTAELSSEQTIKVQKNATTVSKSVIPGKIITNQVENTQQFTATKVDKEQKAQGKIKIYNEATERVTLIKGSQFMSASQQVYLLDERTPVPAAHWSGGEKKPGQVEATVTAAEAGSDYNIKKTKFSIPGLSGSALYHKMYAETASAINGGLKGKTYQVTEQDVKKAKEKVRTELKKQGKEGLTKEGYNIITETVVQNATDTFVSAEPGMATDKFTVQEKVITRALAFKQEDLKRLIDKKAAEKLTGGKVNESSLNLNYEVEEAQLDKGEALINIEFSGKVYSPVGEKSLRQEVRGRGLSDLYSLLESKKEVAEFKVRTRPFWMRSLPSDRERVKINVKID